VHVPTQDIPDIRTDVLQRAVRRLARTWIDDVSTLLRRRLGEADGIRLLNAYASRLPAVYREANAPSTAIDDIATFDALVRSGDELHVQLRTSDEPGVTRLLAYRHGAPLELSGFLPILESLGMTVIEEIPIELEGDGPPLHMHDFGVRDLRGDDIDVDAIGERLAVATLACWAGRAEVDSLNRLVLFAGIDWWQVSVLRAYRRYRRQVGTAYTPAYVNDALAAHPDVVRALIDHFEARFDPELAASEIELTATRQRVRDACDAVERLDHDRIMRSFVALIDATLRTNVFRPGSTVTDQRGVAVPYRSFKLDPAAVPDMPKPVPFREIFVHSPRLEGIHLRGGPVARGGLRWSDRMDDVRTEVLGLMKAQMLKNAVIVPTGAKGGFVLKADVPPEDLRDEVERQYVTFIRGLLDITDDIEGGEIVPPPHVVRHDGDDPYLVVAADKGTATFSDTANRVAEEHGFWLGDAFASGGSRGYDHKALGITARGAWVAVRRHFRELGIDTQVDPIRTVGIGDMSGDVFGNGMLSSRSIRLVAAFDHRDIFLDPDPDPEASFDERRRLYGLPGSSWKDFDPAVISAGGGVWSRHQKSIPLSDEVRRLLRVDDEQLSPHELIHAILRAPVDLLWAGGIGTYVKASTQTHDDIGDRTNDEVRIDADELRARVFGEGANLSITQAGRIQYARRGGRINQDAIDNAAGVDISDHEVNVKILLTSALEAGRIDDADRDRLLVEVTDDVVAHVLRDVDLQTWTISQEAIDSPARTDAYERLMQLLEEVGGLDREVEALPSTDALAERAAQGAGLTRPELATLVGYSKRVLVSDILASALPDDDAFDPALRSYFPPLLVERFGDLLVHHRLRRELIATIVANDVVNRMGVVFAFQLADEAGRGHADVIAAYWAARQVADADGAWRGIEGLDDLLDPDRQLDMKREVDRLVMTLARRYLADPELPDVAAIVRRDGPPFAELRAELMDRGTPQQRQARVLRAQRMMDDLVDDDLATFVACTRDLAMVPDVAAVRRELGNGGDAGSLADAFLRLADELSLDRIARVLESQHPEEQWARLQHVGLAADLRRLRSSAVRRALTESPDADEPEAVRRFLARREQGVTRARQLVDRVDPDDPEVLHAIAVALRTLRTTVEAS
jgi:glutamate dehydrogenase